MDALNIISFILGVASLVFAIFVHYQTKSKKEIELAKNAMLKEKIKAIENELLFIFHNSDMIVQIPKSRDDVSFSELQNLARIIRAQAQLSLNYLNDEEKKLNKWRFGQVVESVELRTTPGNSTT